MSEWLLLFVVLVTLVPAFVLFSRFFRKVRLIVKLRLYLPLFYLLVILSAIALHFVWPAEIVGEGKIKFSVGASIGIMSSLPGIYATGLFEIFGINLPPPLDSAWFGISILVLANFILYWILNIFITWLIYLGKKINSR